MHKSIKKNALDTPQTLQTLGVTPPSMQSGRVQII